MPQPDFIVIDHDHYHYHHYGADHYNHYYDDQDKLRATDDIRDQRLALLATRTTHCGEIQIFTR